MLMPNIKQQCSKILFMQVFRHHLVAFANPVAATAMRKNDNRYCFQRNNQFILYTYLAYKDAYFFMKT